jgi:hypothetical protein
MNKYTDFLEKHVQWVALGIGGLWLLYMVYTFVIVADSSTVDVAGQKVGAASVDKIVQEKAYQLREKIERQDRIPNNVDNYAKLIEDQLKIPTPGPLRDIIVRVPAGRGVGDDPTTVIKDVVKIKELPKAHKPVGIAALPLRSVVRLPGPPLPVGQVGQPVEQDAQLLPYVVVSANFPMPELGKEFSRLIVNQPIPLHQTVLLKTELVREELKPDGSWSKEVITIPSHDFSLQQAPPPWPANNKAQQMNFVQAAQGNQPSLAQPKFVNILRGDTWRLPGTVAQPVGGPNVPPGQNPPEDNPMPQPAPRQPGVRPNPPMPQPRRQPPRTDATPALPRGIVPVAQVFDEPPAPRSMPPAGGAGQPPVMGVNPAGAGGVAAPVIPPANLPGEVPKAAFDPANANVFPMWINDITVVSGKTYRYRMRYTIKNPAFGYNNVCEPAKLGDVFSIDSELSDPTDAITIPHTTIYFAVGAPKLGREIKHVDFHVFTWTVDGLQGHKYQLVPGDMVDPNKNLKMTLVDMRDDGRNVVLMDENGALTTRNVFIDAKSPQLAECWKIIEQQAVAPVAGR